MLRKQYFLLFCFILLAGMFSFARAEAANREALKIARMPLLVASSFSPHADAVDRLEQRLDQALHIPLNSTLHAVEYLDESDVKDAYDAARESAGRRARYKALAKPMAEMLKADIVVLPVLTDYASYQRIGWGWDGDIIRYSRAAVTLVVYDRKRDETMEKRAFRVYDDAYSPRGDVDVLAAACMDQVIREADLHKMLTDEVFHPLDGQGEEIAME